MEKRLGKIESVSFGIGGYQDAMIGIYFGLSSDGWGVIDSTCAWDAETIKCTENCNWTEKSRSEQYDKIMRYISKLLNQAKVKKVEELKNIPIEVVFDGNLLKEWKILTEVL